MASLSCRMWSMRRLVTGSSWMFAALHDLSLISYARKKNNRNMHRRLALLRCHTWSSAGAR
jgi:hypothetical protein